VSERVLKEEAILVPRSAGFFGREDGSWSGG